MTIDLDSIAAALSEMPDRLGRRFVPTVNDQPAVESPGSPDSQDVTLDSNRPSPCGGSFWIGLPWLSLECSRRWVGDRLFFFSSAVPDTKRIAAVSSRLRQRLDLESWWFDLLRTAILQCDSRTEALVVANSTATCPAVSRASTLFGRPIFRFDVSLQRAMNTSQDLRRWLVTCLDNVAVNQTDRTLSQETRILVSPEIKLSDRPSPDLELNHIPVCDRLLFAAASRIQVLSCRTQGNVEELVRAHLHDGERQQVPLWIASNAAGELPAVVADMPAGCIPWLVAPCPPDAGSEVSPSPAYSDDRQSLNLNAVRPMAATSPLSNPDEWLLHWTRAPRGAWPGESEADFLDALILRSESADRSVLATLLKIIADGKLLASSEGIRGGYSVVALTAVPLTEFRSRRVFRKHRHRYDFEPWGIAIQKEQLRRIGVRSVIYGEDEDWRQLELNDRAFFQKATRTGATSNINELEYRSVGSIDLSQFPKNAVCIFVGDSAVAELVSRHCCWPVIVVPAENV